MNAAVKRRHLRQIIGHAPAAKLRTIESTWSRPRDYFNCTMDLYNNLKLKTLL